MSSLPSSAQTPLPGTTVAQSAFLLWGAITSSPVGALWIGAQVLIAAVIALIIIIVNLIVALFTIGYTVLQPSNWPLLIIVGVLNLVLFVIHDNWSGFASFINKDFIPVLQIILDTVIRFTWNELFMPLYNIFAEIWDSLVQVCAKGLSRPHHAADHRILHLLCALIVYHCRDFVHPDYNRGRRWGTPK
jgi:hypothetical protein